MSKDGKDGKARSTIDQIIRASRRGVPLIGVRTLDQPGFVRALAERLLSEGDGQAVPLLLQDPIRGITPGHAPDPKANAAGSGVALRAEQGLIAQALDGGPASTVTDPVVALEAIERLAPDGGLFVCFLGASTWINQSVAALAVMLARDPSASAGRTLIFVGPSLQLAAELGSDLYVIGEELPEVPEREEIVREVWASAVKGPPPDYVMAQALTFTRGLSRFAVAQVAYLALTSKGLDLDVLRGNWREAIDSVPGLRVLVDRPDPDGVQGLAELQAHFRALANGRQRFDSVVFVDEVEKALQGSGASGGGDTSGASQAVLGRLLSHLEDTGSEGMILLGPPGTGKTLSAKAAGQVLQVPTLELQPGRIKGSLVGQTEEQAERCFTSLASLAGRAYWIVTCNGIGALPPELLRRFTDGVWFVDLPSAEERAAIWGVHLKSYEHPADARYNQDTNWTGADIRNVCRTAWRTGRTPSQVGAEHVPSTRASAELIDRLRSQSAGRYRSASLPGAYAPPADDAPVLPTTPRKLRLEGN